MSVLENDMQPGVMLAMKRLHQPTDEFYLEENSFVLLSKSVYILMMKTSHRCLKLLCHTVLSSMRTCNA